MLVVVTPSEQSPSTFSNWNSISATAGNDFWTCVVRSRIIPEVQEYPGNNALVGAISFSETRRIINSQIRQGGGHVLSSQKLLLIVLVSKKTRHELHGSLTHIQVLP